MNFIRFCFIFWNSFLFLLKQLLINLSSYLKFFTSFLNWNLSLFFQIFFFFFSFAKLGIHNLKDLTSSSDNQLHALFTELGVSDELRWTVNVHNSYSDFQNGRKFVNSNEFAIYLKYRDQHVHKSSTRE